MWVLHAHWQPPRRPSEAGGFIFWAESPESKPQGRDHGTMAKRTELKDHPFCLEPETIRLQIGSGTPLDSAQLGAVKLRLPSTRNSPLPSPSLNPEWEPDDFSNPRLQPWLVRGLLLPAGKAFSVLANLPTESTASGFVLGADATYWQHACSLVLEVLAEQKFLPVLEKAVVEGQSEQYFARWLPVLDSPKDGPRLEYLEKSMPPICRAEMVSQTRVGKTIQQASITPHSLLDSFLKSTCDALARTWGRSRVPLLLPEKGNTLDIWLAALFTPDGRVKAAPGQLQALYSSVRAWLRNLHAAGDENFRIAFRLNPPPADETNGRAETWDLQFLLQSRSDPGLLITAEEVWFLSKDELAKRSRRLDHPQELLLAGLGYASRLFNPILTSLQARQPTGVDLDTESAYAFLREAAPLLEQAGFGILTPEWWNQRGARLGVRVVLSPRGKEPADISRVARLGLNTLVHFEWSLSLGETTLTREEFEALAALQSPLVKVRGQWVQLDTEQVEAAVRFWEKQQHSGEMGLLEAAQLALGGETAHGLPLDEVQGEGWIGEWLDNISDSQRMTELPQPAGLNGTLRPYQRFGFSWLAFFRRWGLGACLADDMGLGKTIQALALLLHEKESLGKLPGPVLLVCPTSVAINWQREAARFAPSLRTMVHQGPNRLKNSEFANAARDADLVVTSYALLRMDQDLIQPVNWYGIILDEAQNIKNPSAKQTQAARKLKSTFRLAMTGTPLENRLTELWSIMQFLNPGYLSSLEKFRREFAIPIERFGDHEATTLLRQMVSPFILRRLKTDPRVIQDLPDKLETKEMVYLSEEQASLYEAVVKDSLHRVAESDGLERRGLVLAMLTRLKQVCNHPAQYLKQSIEREISGDHVNGRSGKLTRLSEMLDEVISAGDRALVSTQYAEMGNLLTQYLPSMLNVPVYYLHGGTPPAVRDQLVTRFQEDSSAPPVFILSLKAGGFGLNLTRASHVFHYDRWWNPAVENQATDRAYRIGQQQNVQVHKFITLGTLEERIDQMIESKLGLLDAVIGGGDEWLTELSTDELRDLVSLRR
jgi:SNF2 family DNA or RNA helicase